MIADNPAENFAEAIPLTAFAPATGDWFSSTFGAPTPVQSAAWEAIRSGSSTLVIAPTGSGKTLAAFMYLIDRLFEERTRERGGKRQEPAAENPGALHLSS